MQKYLRKQIDEGLNDCKSKITNTTNFNNRFSNNGYTLLELIMTVTILIIALTVVVANLPASFATMSPESVLAHTGNLILSARENSAAGVADEGKRTVNFEQILSLPHRGVEISLTPKNVGANNCQFPTNNLKQSVICVSNQAFSFSTSNVVNFTRFSSKTSEPHAIFFTNTKRQLALLVNQSGNLLVAEYINGEWKSRTDLQDLFVVKKDVNPKQ
ncbi:MAG: type II secretion system protein [Blastocatellia bacterium]